MDTYENENVIGQPQEEPMEPTQQCSEGFYHGTGAGVTEDTGCTETAAPIPEPATEPVTEPEKQPQSGPKPLKKKGKKVLKTFAAIAAALALVASGCGISVGIMNYHWRQQNENLIRNFEQRLEVLQNELNGYQNGGYNYTVSAEGLTPSQIYEQNIDSVVAVNCVIRTTSMGKVYESTSAGSGFVLTEDGYVVTNHHVIDGANSISVVFSNGKTWDAALIGSDATNDIALLKIEATDLQPVTVGSSDALKVGEQVVAIGNALGELSFSLTVGYVSGTDRNISTDGSVINMIQTDMAINSGNSGGPMFNAKGEVVGITSAKYSGTTSSGASIEGISFAIPMDDVIGMLRDLQEFGYIKSAYMGIMVQDVMWSASEAEMYNLPMGVYVKSVVEGGAAANAGIVAKDIITNVGGYSIESMTDLTRALRQFQVGEETTVVIWRSGQQLVMNVVFDEKPQS